MEHSPVRHNTPAPCGYERDKLKALHAQIVRLSVMGWSNKEIADNLGISVPTVTKTLKSDVGRRRESALQAAADKAVMDIQAELRVLAPAAIGVIERVLCDEDAPLTLRHRAAGDILDRLGYSKVNRSEISMRHGRLAELGEDALARAAIEAGVIQDATYEEVSDAELSEEGLEFGEPSLA